MQGLLLLTFLSVTTTAHAARLVWRDDGDSFWEGPPVAVMFVVEPPIRRPDVALLPRRARRALARFEEDGELAPLLARLGDSPEEFWTRVYATRQSEHASYRDARGRWLAVAASVPPDEVPEVPLLDASELVALDPGPLILAGVALDPRAAQYDPERAWPLLEGLAQDAGVDVAVWARLMLALRESEGYEWDRALTRLPSVDEVPPGPLGEVLAFENALALAKRNGTGDAGDALAEIDGDLRPAALMYLWEELSFGSRDLGRTFSEQVEAILARHPDLDAAAFRADLAALDDEMGAFAIGASFERIARRHADDALWCADQAGWPSGGVTLQIHVERSRVTEWHGDGEVAGCLGRSAVSWGTLGIDGDVMATWMFVPYRPTLASTEPVHRRR